MVPPHEVVGGVLQQEKKFSFSVCAKNYSGSNTYCKNAWKLDLCIGNREWVENVLAGGYC